MSDIAHVTWAIATRGCDCQFGSPALLTQFTYIKPLFYSPMVLQIHSFTYILSYARCWKSPPLPLTQLYRVTTFSCTGYTLSHKVDRQVYILALRQDLCTQAR